MLRRIALVSAWCVLQAAVASAQMIISEFRVRGPNGANDEFIELYNNSDSQHTVAGGGTGYALVASDGTARCVVPNGTIIPARGHYLCINSVGYSLTSYPAGNGTTATGDATYATDIPDNFGLALFNTSVIAGYTLANRLDAVGATSEANTLYKEGTGYPALTPFSIDYAFVRKLLGGCTGSAGGVSGNCNTLSLIQTTPGPTSQLQDTNNNAGDFIFVDTNGTSAGAGQRLGAPGPENSFSPTSLEGFALTASKLDTCVGRHNPPNVVRDFTSDPAQNSTFGTFDIRRTFTNTTGLPITRLRFRILDITTFPSISGADRPAATHVNRHCRDGRSAAVWHGHEQSDGTWHDARAAPQSAEWIGVQRFAVGHGDHAWLAAGGRGLGRCALPARHPADGRVPVLRRGRNHPGDELSGCLRDRLGRWAGDAVEDPVRLQRGSCCRPRRLSPIDRPLVHPEPGQRALRRPGRHPDPRRLQRRRHRGHRRLPAVHGTVVRAR